MFSASLSLSPVPGRSTPPRSPGNVGETAPQAGDFSLLGNTRELRNPQLILLGKLDREISRYRLQETSRKLLPHSNVTGCLRNILGGSDPSVQVEVWGKPGKAQYRNLYTCGLVWVCPVCASKITEKRRLEIQTGFNRWKDLGGALIHLVLTFPHSREQRLAEILPKFSEARRKMLNRKGWKRMAARIGLEGSLRALEVTYGVNGWHVHTHEALFVPGAFYRAAKDDPYCDPFDEELDGWDLCELQSEILDLWGTACLDVGLGLINEHGVTVQDGRHASKYLSKWGLESELTKSHLKQGRAGSLSPFDLLRAVSNGEGDYSWVFQEYASAFKGKLQLTWSHGMAKRLKLVVETDGEAAGEPDPAMAFLAALTRSDWYRIYRAEIRGDLIAAAASGGRDGLLAFLRKVLGEGLRS